MPRLNTTLDYGYEHSLRDILKINFINKFIVIKQYFVREHDFCPHEEFVIFKDIKKMAKYLLEEIDFIQSEYGNHKEPEFNYKEFIRYNNIFIGGAEHRNAHNIKIVNINEEQLKELKKLIDNRTDLDDVTCSDNDTEPEYDIESDDDLDDSSEDEPEIVLDPETEPEDDISENESETSE